MSTVDISTQERKRWSQQRRAALSIADAAREAGCGRDKIYTAIRSGQLIARKFGRRTIICADDFDRFLNELPVLELGGAE
jgi:excisionase family DNA binding protein